MVCEALQNMDSTTSLEGTIDAIRQRMSEVNAKLHQASIREHDPIVSGSTVAVFVVQRTACAMVWAGDSRIYRLRHKRLTQLTTDHTWASELNLQQPTEEADHAITRAVGGEDTLLLDVRRDRVRLGDRYLLCSDGLTRELTDAQITDLMGGEDVQQCAKALIDATLQAGARDNVSVVVIEAT
jgi:serine/threonine protein phosphatase PrpC